jgi:hypothetical protein
MDSERLRSEQDDIDYCEQCEAVVRDGGRHSTAKHGGSEEAEELRNTFFRE